MITLLYSTALKITPPEGFLSINSHLPYQCIHKGCSPA